ncbi:MAG: 16S rRNA (adenine(1518)-N(6)/adenine(1519)-N(6))-dimethyltransferase RsmA [PVC group bacterium]
MNDNSLFSPAYLRGLLKAAGLSARKSRGQTFLIDRNIAEKIIRSAGLGRDDAVLEIGPGPGTLTRELCRRAARVIAVEWDRGLVRVLREQTRDCSNLEVLEEDFLKTDLAALAARLGAGRRPGSVLKVVANLPYSISGPLVAKLIESDAGFSLLVLMVQKEMGERIVSPPGRKRYGRLSVLARMYSRPRIVAAVCRNSFFPRPRVDSVIVRFDIIPPDERPVRDLALWRPVAAAAFAQRRKMLKNALAAGRGLDYTEEQIVTACSRAGIDPKDRAENLSADDFYRLASALGEIKMDR